LTARLTPLALSILTLGAWGLVFAVLSGRAELVVVVIPALFGLLRRARLPSPDAWHITHAVSTERAFEGDRVVVTVTVRAERPIALLELFEPLPPSLRVVSGFNRGFFTLARGGEARWRYEVECRRRGRSTLGTLHARLWTRGGLHASERSIRLPVSLRVYPRTSPLKRLPRPSRTQTSVGNYVASSVGEGLEPADIRTFAPGDRLRHVNWRASLRFRRLFVTQYHQERNADIVLMLDALTELGAPPATTLDASIRAAASLASAYLARRDRVGLVEYSGPFRWVRPSSGRVQLERLLDALLRADVVFSYVQGDVALVPRRVLPPQSLVVAISPLLDARFEKALVDLAGRGFEVVIVSPSPIPIVRESVRQSPSVDLACRLWAIDRRARAAALHRLGLTVIEWNPNDSLEVALGAIGRARRRGVAS
jgi:uncharacterized protein (DUF58 family)